MTKIIIKTLDGKMGFSEIPDDYLSDGTFPTSLTTEDERTFVFTDWCGQFNGPSIPVYTEIKL